MLLNAIASIILAAMMLIPIVNVVVGAYVGVAIGGLLGGVSGILLAVAIAIVERLIADRLGWPSSQVGGTTETAACQSRSWVGLKSLTKIWRRGWDSNPRDGFPPTRFPSVRLQPLGHPSWALSVRDAARAKAAHYSRSAFGCKETRALRADQGAARTDAARGQPGAVSSLCGDHPSSRLRAGGQAGLRRSDRRRRAPD